MTGEDHLEGPKRSLEIYRRLALAIDDISPPATEIEVLTALAVLIENLDKAHPDMPISLRAGLQKLWSKPPRLRLV